MAIYVTMITWTLPTIQAAAGGLPAFDMRPGGYDFAAAQTFLTALSQDGRDLYLGAQHRLDLIYPGLLALTLILGLRLVWAPRLATQFSIAACVAAVADYTENMLVGRMLRQTVDAVTPDMVASANWATLVKSAGDTIAMTALLIGGLLALYRRFRPAKS